MAQYDIVKNLTTVIIATYNRCESLKDTLESLLHQACNGSFDYEIIVADNNSTDRTKQVVENYQKRFNGKLKYLFEPKQGKCYALNKAIKQARGEIVAFTDDDVIVEKRWLAEIVKALSKPDIGIVGGIITPIWLSERPGWLSEEFYGKLAIQDYGDKPFIISSVHSDKLPFGANYSFKKDLFYKCGFFDEQMRFSHDTEICRRFIKKGVKVGYNPKIKVHHKIDASRLNEKYLYKWCYRRGKVFNHIKNPNLFRLCADIINKLVSCLWCRIKKDPENSFYHKTRIFYNLGRLREKLANPVKLQ